MVELTLGAGMRVCSIQPFAELLFSPSGEGRNVSSLILEFVSLIQDRVGPTNPP